MSSSQKNTAHGTLETRRSKLLLLAAVGCFLMLACTGTTMIGLVENVEPLGGPAYWTAATGSPVPTETRFMGYSTAVIPPTPTPYEIIETSESSTYYTTWTPVPAEWWMTATPTWQATQTPWWVTTTPEIIYNSSTTTPVPPWTTTPELPMYAQTTPVPTETAVYHVGRFYQDSDVYLGSGYAPVVRMTDYQQVTLGTNPPRTWHYVTLIIRNETDSRDILMPISDVFFIRRIEAPDGTIVQGEWVFNGDPLPSRGLPRPEEYEATPIAVNGQRSITISFVTPPGRMMELGLATDWQRGIEYGLPVWFVPQPNPQAPFMDAEHPPPPTSAYLDDVAAYNGSQQPAATVGAGTPWPTLPAGAISRWPTSGTLKRGFACQDFFTGVDGTGWGCPEHSPWFHPGVDIGNTTGNPVMSPVTGDVTFAGVDEWGANCSDFAGSDYPHTGFGNYVKVSGEGMLHYFAHLSSFSVGYGHGITAGQLVGGMGSTGCSTGSHLHWQVKVNGQFINPAVWAGAGPP